MKKITINVDELFYQACAQGNLEAVKNLAQSVKDINKNNDGFTPLSIAHAKGHTRVVDFLLEKGAKPLLVLCQLRFNQLKQVVEKNNQLLAIYKKYPLADSKYIQGIETFIRDNLNYYQQNLESVYAANFNSTLNTLTQGYQKLAARIKEMEQMPKNKLLKLNSLIGGIKGKLIAYQYYRQTLQINEEYIKQVETNIGSFEEYYKKNPDMLLDATFEKSCQRLQEHDQILDHHINTSGKIIVARDIAGYSIGLLDLHLKEQLDWPLAESLRQLITNVISENLIYELLSDKEKVIEQKKLGENIGKSLIGLLPGFMRKVLNEIDLKNSIKSSISGWQLEANLKKQKQQQQVENSNELNPNPRERKELQYVVPSTSFFSDSPIEQVIGKILRLLAHEEIKISDANQKKIPLVLQQQLNKLHVMDNISKKTPEHALKRQTLAETLVKEIKLYVNESEEVLSQQIAEAILAWQGLLRLANQTQSTANEKKEKTDEQQTNQGAKIAKAVTKTVVGSVATKVLEKTLDAILKF